MVAEIGSELVGTEIDAEICSVFVATEVDSDLVAEVSSDSEDAEVRLDLFDMEVGYKAP